MIQNLLRHRLKLCRIVNRPCSNNSTLTLHQSGYRGDCANRTGIGNTDGGLLEIFNGKRPGSGFTHDIRIGMKKLFKVHRVDSLNIRNHQISFSVFALYINSNS